MRTRAVLFDLDETLILEDESLAATYRNVCAPLAEAADRGVDEIVRIVRTRAREIWRTLESHAWCRRIGISSSEGMTGRFAGDGEEITGFRRLLPGYRIDAWTGALAELGIGDRRLAKRLAEELVAERRRHHVAYPDAIAVLERLKPEFRIGLVTNGAPSVQREKIERSEVSPWLEAIVVSGEVGVGKPDPRPFRRALELLGVSAAEAVMVGDSSAHDVAGAQGAGIAAIHLDRRGIGPLPGVVPDASIATLDELDPLLASDGGPGLR